MRNLAAFVYGVINSHPCRQCGHRFFSSARFFGSRNSAAITTSTLKPSRCCPGSLSYQLRRKSSTPISTLVVPVPIDPLQSDGSSDVGEEITGKLNREEVLKVLNLFYRRPEIKKLAEEHGIDSKCNQFDFTMLFKTWISTAKIFHQAFVSFRKYCAKSAVLPPELHILFSDVISGAGHTDDLFPFFLKHSKQCFPHLDCMDDLKKISDLRSPANWYPEARLMQRRVIFHEGPTNSGKTYEAMEHYLKAKSGIYCGPLKLLANEVFTKTNTRVMNCSDSSSMFFFNVVGRTPEYFVSVGTYWPINLQF